MKSTVIISVIAVLAAVALSTGCAPTFGSADHLRTKPLERYHKPIETDTLQPGDRIQILLHLPELQNIPATIDDRGCVTVPFIGSVKISGLPSAKAEQVIKQEYVRRGIYKDGAIQVGILPAEKKCYVGGHVKRAGDCLFSRPITLNQAIANAGGPDEFADNRKTDLTRGGKKTRIDREKDGDSILVEPGDIIEVIRGTW